LASDGLVLGFDTSAAHCAAALLSGDGIVASLGESMARGQAERLMPLLDELLTGAGAAWHDLDRIGVGVGPGNFTGIRISVAAARGLALALDIPAVGVSSFDAIGFGRQEAHCPAVPAPRNQIYLRRGDAPPELMGRAEAEALYPPMAYPPEPAKHAEAIALIAARARAPLSAPVPLYIRQADAVPPREAPPVILDDDA